jgi:putative protease
MKEQEIGFISKYFGKINVGAIDLTAGELNTGDVIHIQGHTTDLEETITSMQIEHASVSEAKAGDSIGLKVSEKVRRGDKVFKVLKD